MKNKFQDKDQTYIERDDGSRVSFAYICRLTDHPITLAGLKRSPGWESLTPQERARLEKLFEGRVAYFEGWHTEMPEYYR